MIKKAMKNLKKTNYFFIFLVLSALLHGVFFIFSFFYPPSFIPNNPKPPLVKPFFITPITYSQKKRFPFKNSKKIEKTSKKTLQEDLNPQITPLKEDFLLKDNNQETKIPFVEQDFLPLNQNIQEALPKTPLIPPYPFLARKAGVEGKVVLDAFINELGQVKKVVVLKGLGFGCDEAAIKKVSQTLFTPASFKGEALKVRQKITFEFILQ